jgi:hypothetical protein
MMVPQIEVTRCVVHQLGWREPGLPPYCTALQDIIRASYHIRRNRASARGYRDSFLCFFFLEPLSDWPWNFVSCPVEIPWLCLVVPTM